MKKRIFGGKTYDTLYILPEAKHAWILCCWLDINRSSINNASIDTWLLLLAMWHLIKIYITEGLKGVDWNKEEVGCT